MQERKWRWLERILTALLCLTIGGTAGAELVLRAWSAQQEKDFAAWHRQIDSVKSQFDMSLDTWQAAYNVQKRNADACGADLARAVDIIYAQRRQSGIMRLKPQDTDALRTLETLLSEKWRQP